MDRWPLCGRMRHRGLFMGVYDGSQYQRHLMTLEWKMRLPTGNCTDFVGLATVYEQND